MILKRTHRLASPTTVLTNMTALARCVRYRLLLLHRWLLHLLLWHSIIYWCSSTSIRLLLLLLLLLLMKHIQISLRYSFAASMLFSTLYFIINGDLLTFNSRFQILFLLLLLLVWLLLLMLLLLLFVCFWYSLSPWTLLWDTQWKCFSVIDVFPLLYAEFSWRELL